MSVNTANTPDGNGVLIFNGEVILVFTRDVTMAFEKNSNQIVSGKKVGLLYLTSHRIIFMPNDNRDGLISFDMPFSAMSDVKLEQPIFGANYLHGIATAQPGSGLAGEIPWKITFTKGGCIEFGHALLRAVDIASRYRPTNAPPAYAPPAGAFYAAPPDYYQPSQDGYNGFQPPSSTFQEQPDNVFMQEAPPPYPGLGPDRAPLPTEQLARAGESAAPPPYAPDGAGEVRRRNVGAQ